MNISSWLIHNINVATVSGVNSSGERTYNAYAAKKARVENSDKIIQSGNGNDLKADYVLVTDFEIGIKDRVWLPDDDPTTDEPYVPMSIKNADVKTGVYRIYETYIGRGTM